MSVVRTGPAVIGAAGRPAGTGGAAAEFHRGVVHHQYGLERFDSMRKHAAGTADADLNFQVIRRTTDFGQTLVVDQGKLDEPAWHRPSR